MSARLITHGCSLAYGHGLVDCFKEENNEAGPVASELSFANGVARKLNRDCINTSRPGASNKEIWTKAINFDYNPKDIVIIQWTYPDRHIVYNDNGTETELAPWNDSNASKTYYAQFHSNIDTLNDFYLRLNQLNDFYNNIDIKHINLIPNNKYYADTPKWNKAVIEPLYIEDICRELNDYALDNVHPGEKTHFAFTRQLYKILK